MLAGMAGRRKRASLWAALSAVLMSSLFTPAHAQTFTDTTVAAIGDNTACPNAVQLNGNTPNNLSRTFNVSGLPGAGSVTGINVGLIASHTWRGDIRLTLTNPAGTSRQIIVPDTSNAGNIDNYNIELVDGASPTVNQSGTGGDHTTPDDVNAAPYQNTVAPDATIAPLIAGSMNGAWRLDLCDNYFGSDNGQYRRSSLTFAVAGATDLSLAVAAANTLPPQNGSTTVTYTLRNNGPAAAGASTVALAIPSTVTVTSQNASAGTVSGSTWTVPSLASGATAVLTLGVDVGTNAATFSGEVATAAQADPDSTPGNNSTTEDDDDSVQIFPQPSGTVAPLSCSIGEVYTMAWSPTGANSWPQGSLSNAYNAVDTDGTTADIPLTLTMSAPGGNAAAQTFFSGAATPPSPNARTGWTGGVGGVAALYVGVNFGSTGPNARVDMTMDLGIPAEGVEGFQFTITDIDQGSYVDRITVNGFANGQPVPTPVLTPGANVFISGNSGISRNTGNQPPESALGNLTVTFNSPVDQIVFNYDNAPNASPTPNTQAVALQDLKVCRRLLPDVDAVKTVEVFDPANAGLFMTPGNEVLYKIAATNSASAEAPARDLDITDTLPDNLQFVSATTTGFTNGAFNNLPNANTDCNNGQCVISFEGAELPVNTTGEVVVRALIK